MVVGERDQVLVAAAVVPLAAGARAAAPRRRRGCSPCPRSILGVLVVAAVSSTSATWKNGVGGSCLAVAGDDQLLAAVDAVDRVLGRDLRCLVEDDEVELVVGREEVADRQRAHHQARLELGEQASASRASSLRTGRCRRLLAGLRLEERHLRAGAVDERVRGAPLRRAISRSAPVATSAGRAGGTPSIQRA